MRAKQSTYLLITDFVATDLAGNKVIPYTDGLALACKTYIPDEDPPVLLRSQLVSNLTFHLMLIYLLRA